MIYAVFALLAWSPQHRPLPRRHRSRPAVCSIDELLVAQTDELLQQLDLAEEEPEDSLKISDIHAKGIAPLRPAVWSSEFPDREDAIKTLSDMLDQLEVASSASSGPLLAGSSFSSCDAQCYPTFCLLSWTLPKHFGWYEYTTDALFWKRPRLHSWFELCSYETPCAQAAARIEEALQAIDYWPSISVDVPTNKLRRNMRKDI